MSAEIRKEEDKKEKKERRRRRRRRKNNTGAQLSKFKGMLGLTESFQGSLGE